ncbi:MAG: hypothetical protein IPM47_08250 [Sphingobacteriales bacterium]|nr:MAG: hypothetical protein IPM47_08250 [Sphingobacteriales bacterium]
MKRLYTLLILCTNFICLTSIQAQNILLEVDGDDLYYSESGCGDCAFSSPDPRWRSRLFVGASNYDWNVDRNDVSCGWQGITNYSWYNATTVGYSTNVSMQLNGFEFDDELTCFFNANDASCGGYGTVNSAFAASSVSPCMWNYFTGQRNCSSDGTTGTWAVYWSLYWRYQFAPVLSSVSPANQVRCNGAAPATLTATSSTDGNGRVLARWYKWQISNTPGGPWSDIPGAANGSTNTNATMTLTPGQISGTRYYRVLTTSNCSADFSSNNTTSSVYTVTYAFIASGPYTNQSGWPFGTGDGAPAIQSPICGSTVSPGQVVTLNTLQPPSSGHVTNASYAWAVSGGSLSSSSGSSVNWTLPSTNGNYSVSVTYNFSGCSSPYTAVCTTTVGDPACDFIYVATTGTDIVGGGGPSNPFATLSFALSQAVANSISHIKVRNGNYTQSSILNLQSNIQIEGGFDVVSGVWTKSSNSTTNISCNSSIQSVSGVCHRIGFSGNSVSGWALVDLNVSTTAATGVDASNRGCSNYALWLSGCSNYSIVRCNFTSGAAANGTAATTSGGSGGAGGGGNGGGGSGGVSGCGNPSAGATGAAGNGGAAGGSGGDTGSGGICCGSSRPGKAGTGGTGGNASTSYPAGSRPTTPAPTSASYYTPGGTAASGSNGFGGGGGGGGGGSRGGTCACINCSGNTGGTGGAGGGGGLGGGGGTGGGGSFAIWRFNSATGATLTNTNTAAGTGGTGGNGASGQSGSSGTVVNNGNTGGSCVCGNPQGGSGGNGGNGGNGGRGQDGANGSSAQIVSNGTTSSGSSIPSTPAITIIYNNNMKICRNSVLTINNTSGSGNWTLPANFDYVRYNQSATASQYSNSTFLADIYPTNNTAGYYNLQAGATVYPRYLSLEPDARTAPVITLNNINNGALPGNQICAGGSLKATASTFGTIVDYRWEIFSGSSAPNKSAFPSGSAIFSSNIANPTFGPFNTAGTYTVRYQVRERCCGWSIPVFATITVNPDPTPPTNILFVNASVVCIGDLITASSATGATGGITPYSYEWDYNNMNHSFGTYSGALPSFAATTGANIVRVRIAADEVRGCDASNIYEETINGVEVPVGVTANPLICSGETLNFNLTTANSISGTTFAVQSQSSNPNISGTGSISSGTVLTGTFTNTSGTDQNLTFTITPTGPTPANCIGSNFVITLTVRALPGLYTVTGGGNYCEGDIGLSVGLNGSQNGVSYELYHNGSPTGVMFLGTGAAFNFSSIQTLPGTYTVEATNQTSGCKRMMTGNVIIVVNPLPNDLTPVAVAPLICSGTATNIQIASSEANVNYQLRNNAGNINIGTPVGGGGTINLPTGSLTANTTFNVLATNTITGCIRVLTMLVTVNVLENPTGGSIAPVIFCAGATETAFVTGVGNAVEYQWDLPAGLSGSSTTSSILLSGNTAGIYTITVTPVNISGVVLCNGIPVTGSVTVKPTPTVTATNNNSEFCTGGITDIGLSALPANVSGTVFNWTRDNTTDVIGTNSATGVTGTIAETLTNITNQQQIVVFYITPFADGCSGTVVTVSVTVNPTPSVTVDNLDPVICTGEMTNISLSPLNNNVSGTTYSWTRNNTGNITGTDSETNISGPISVVLTNSMTTNQTTQFTITPYANGCPGSPFITTVQVGAMPVSTANVTAVTPICEGSNTIITVGPPTQSGYTYQVLRSDFSPIAGASISSAGTGAKNITVPASELGYGGSPYLFFIRSTSTSPYFCSAVLFNAVTVVVNQASVAPTGATANGQASLTICPNASEDITLTAVGGLLGTNANAYWFEGACFTTIIGTGTSLDIPAPSVTTTYFVTYFDAVCGATACASVEVIVEDITPPTAVCQDVSVLLDITGIGSTSATAVNNGSYDACGIASLSLNQTGFSCLNVGGSNSVTLTVTDNNGLTATCSALVSVADQIPPEALCQNITVLLDEFGNAGITVADINNGSNDACGIADMVLTQYDFDCTDVGNNSVRLTVTDVNGNESLCLADVVVADEVNPVATCQDITVVIDETGTGAITPAMIDNGSTDACGIDTYNLNQTLFDCDDLGSSTVILTVTDNNGNTATCSAALSIIPDFEPEISPPGTTTICQGESVNLDAGVYAAYLWNDTAGDATTQTVSASASGTYSVTVTDDNGCTATASATVVVNDVPTPSVTADGPTTFCQGNSVGLDAGTYVGYLWNSLAGNATTQTVIATENGTYTVTVTDINGCTATAGIEISVFAAPLATINGVSSICQGNSLFLIASGGNSYSWSGPDGFITTGHSVVRNNAVPDMSGTYTVTVTSTNGCVSITSINITVHPTPVAGISGLTAVCEGSAIDLTATGGTSYEWSGPNGFSDVGANLVRNNAALTMSGVYTVTVTGPGGCTSTASALINVSPVAADILGQSGFCSDGDISLIATGGGTYQWSGPEGFSSTDESILIGNATTAMSGLYVVTVTNTAGCTATASKSVTVNSSPSPTILGNTSLCSGSSIFLVSSGGNSYLWSGPDGFTSTGHSIVRSGATTLMSGIYTVTVNDTNGCTGATSIEVTVHQTPATVITGSTVVCVGNTITLNATGGGVSYQWSGPGGYTASGETISRTGATTAMSGTYYVTVTGSGGCTATASKTVNVTSSLSAVITGPSVFCTGNNISLTASGGSVYSWFGPGGFTSSDATFVRPNATTAMAGLYTVTVSDGAGCSATASRNITVNISPTANITGNNSVCAGKNITLYASGGNSYAWSGPNGFSTVGSTLNRTAATVAMSGTYTVTVTASGGCTATASMFVTVHPLPVVTITGPSSVCAGTTLTLTATGGGTYAWSGPGGFTATGATMNRTNMTTTMGGLYKVTVTGSGGCTATASKSITVLAAPNATITGSSSLCAGGTITLTASGGISYAWSGPDGFTATGSVVTRTNATTAMSGIYVVTVSNSAGCTKTASRVVTVNSCKFEGETGEIFGEFFTAAPNPTKGETTIFFAVPSTVPVKITVFATDGKEVAVLFEDTAQAGKEYSIQFDMKELPAGAYFAVLRKPDGSGNQLQLLLSR